MYGDILKEFSSSFVVQVVFVLFCFHITMAAYKKAHKDMVFPLGAEEILTGLHHAFTSSNTFWMNWYI